MCCRAKRSYLRPTPRAGYCKANKMSIDIRHGDNLDILPTLTPRSVQCVVTSPPYFGLRDYGIAPSTWPAIEYAPMAGIPPISVPAQVVCLGLEADPIAYVAHLVHVFRLLRDVLRDDGTAFLNLGDSYVNNPSTSEIPRSEQGNGSEVFRVPPQKHFDARRSNANKATAIVHSGLKKKDLMMIPARVALALQADGWYLRNQAIWHKPNAMPESVTDRLTNDYEPVYLLAKSARYYFDQNAIRTEHTSHIERQSKPATPRGTYASDGRSLGREQQSESFHPAGRNRRTVWTIPTQALRAEHYAPMPEALVEPCILAGSAAKACEHCGAAWVRLVERTDEIDTSAKGSRFDTGKTGTNGMGRVQQGERYTKRVAGFAPGCACPGNTGAASSIVLDPYFGSGTTGRVAIKYGRRCIGIDKNDSYIDMSDRRTNGVQVHMDSLA